MRASPPVDRVPPRALSVDIAHRLEVRLDGLDDALAGRVVRPLLPLVAPGDRPDIVVRFADDVPTGGQRLWPLPAGPADDGLWVSDHLGRAARIPLGVLDGDPVVVDRRIDPGFFHTWVWLPVVRLALVRAGGTLVHAAGVSWEGRRIAFGGWGGTGKTAVLLECLIAGAGFLGDDWLAIFEDATVAPITARLNLNPSHRQALAPAAWPGSRGAAAVGVVGRRALAAAARVTGRLSQISTAFGRARDLARAVGRTKVALPDLFPATPVAESGPLDTMVLLTRVTPPPEASGRVAEALAAMNRVELAHLDQLVAALRHLWPGAVPEEWEDLPGLDRCLVRDALMRVDTTTRRMAGHRGEALVTGRWLLRDRSAGRDLAPHVTDGSRRSPGRGSPRPGLRRTALFGQALETPASSRPSRPFRSPSSDLEGPLREVV